MGYHRAGFNEIVGVDIRPMPRYPFVFVQGDALDYLREHGHEFDAIHASPPCQGYSRLRFVRGRDMSEYPMLVEDVRAELVKIGKPWVIENVPDAPLVDPLMLCGTMFGLRTHKHRCFEMSHPFYFAPALCNQAPVKQKGSDKRLAQWHGMDAPMVTVAGHLFSKASGSRAMDIDWMTRDELAEAIPPAFTEYVGWHILEVCRAITERNLLFLHKREA